LRLWHLWYDDYEKGTVFITEGEMTDTPVVVFENIPYKEGFEKVVRHNAELTGLFSKFGGQEDDEKEKH